MRDYRINTNYAKALLLLATERGEADRVRDDMKLVSRVTAENRELRVVFANPTVPHDRKAGLARALFEGNVAESTMAFLLFVVKKNRSVNLHGISESYLEQWRSVNGVVLSDLVTHQPIDDRAREMVTNMVHDYTGKTVELRDYTDEKMLGSFKLEFDNKMYDARIRTKIRKLRLEFNKNDYESKL